MSDADNEKYLAPVESGVPSPILGAPSLVDVIIRRIGVDAYAGPLSALKATAVHKKT